MKTSETLVASLGAMSAVTTTGDLRRIVANSMLALARKQISATDLLAMAKGLDSVSGSMQTEINLVKARIEMHKHGGSLTSFDKDAGMGHLSIAG